MIDPFDITDYNRTDDELEELLLFIVLSANKPAIRMAKALDYLLSYGEEGDSPFLTIRRMVFTDTLLERMVEARTGQYAAKSRTFTELSLNYAGMTLRTASVDDLESIYGIGAKTARMFILHTRPDSNVAVLDTHILKHLREIGVEKVPLSTPNISTVTGLRTYTRLTEEFLKDAERHGRTPADHDLILWSKYAVKPQKEVIA